MERLTYRIGGVARYQKCDEAPCHGAGCMIPGCRHEYAACERLAQYEDLGATPEQLKEIDKQYAKQCREISELKQQLAAVHADWSKDE